MTAAKINGESPVISGAFTRRLERDIRHALASFLRELIEKSRQIALEGSA